MTSEDIPGYFTFHEVYESFLDQAEDEFVFVEIGTLLGKSACYFLEQMEERELEGKVYTVDSFEFEDNIRNVLPRGGGEVPEWNREVAIARVQNWVGQHPAGEFLVERSDEASERFSEDSVDFVYLDGDHSYEGVTSDIRAWKPKLKSGGWMGGHDYDLDSVESAVHDAFGCDAVEEMGRRSWVIRDA